MNICVARIERFDDRCKEVMVAAFVAGYGHLDPQEDLGVVSVESFMEEVCADECRVQEERPADIEIFGVWDGDQGPLAIVITDAGLDRDVVYIRQIACLPSLRRCGAGTALIAKVRERHPDKKLCAVTRRVNRSSIGFFGAQGFTVNESFTHPDYPAERYVGLVGK